jgi:hypothetical protein
MPSDSPLVEPDMRISRHPALLQTLALGIHRQLRGVGSQIKQPHALKLFIVSHPLRRSEGPLAAPSQVLHETVAHVRVDLPQGHSWIPYREVVRPSLQMPVHFLDQLRYGLETLTGIRFTVMSSCSVLGASPHPPRGVSQVPPVIYPRALPPSTPESPLSACARSFTTGSRFVISARLIAFRLRNKAESGSLARRLGCSPHKFPPEGLLHPTLASATCRTGNLHGELLSVHQISQAYPGIPETQS